jgi:hypothetical protein
MPLDSEATPVVADPTPEVSTPETPVPSPREALYAKYDEQFSPPPEPAVVEPESPGEVADTPVTPDLVVPDAAPPAVAPSASDLVLSRLTALLETQAARLDALQLQLNPAAPPEAPPEPAFIARLREGDIAGAEAAMMEAVLAKINKGTQPPVNPQTLVANAVETMRLENDLGVFLTDLRAKNPDILPMENYIAVQVQSNIAARAKAGELTSGPKYAAAYKEECAKEFKTARAILQASRAAGGAAARTTQSTVLATTTLTPTPVNPDRGIPAPAAAAPDISPQSYLEKRNAASYKGQGFGRT